MCVSVCACVCLCVCKCHRLNLHGDDVPFSQAPAGIRGGGGGGEGGGGGVSQPGSQSRRGKEHQNGRRALARCLCTEKNQASEDHSAPFTFWDHLGCSNLGDTWVTTATHADIEELVRLRQFQKKKKKKSLVETHLKNIISCAMQESGSERAQEVQGRP